MVNVARYPVLELLEFKSVLKLQKMYNIHKLKSIRTQMFPQVWGSTALGFDKMENGEPAFAGQMITEAYTTVFTIEAEVRHTEKKMVEKFNITEKEIPPQEMEVTVTEDKEFYVVCFGEEPCYLVENPTNAFFDDLASHKMQSLSRAAEVY